MIAEELTPLQSLDMEMSVLGSMMLDQNAAEELAASMEDDDFYRPAHREIFRAMKALIRKGSEIDFVTLKDQLGSKLFQAGGEEYLMQIAEFVPSCANASYYAQVVIDKATMRALEKVGREIVGSVHAEDDVNADDKVESASQKITNLAGRRHGKKMRDMASLSRQFFVGIDDVIESGEAKTGVPSGFSDLDRKTTGFYPGNLIIVGGRPSMGKTSFALSLALAAAQRGDGAVAIFSLEMTDIEITTRLVSMVSGLNSHAFHSANISPDTYRKMADACEHLYALPIFVHDGSETTSAEIRAKCRSLKVQGGLSLVVVDYIELVKSPAKTSRRDANLTEEIGAIAKSLKATAKELGVPVVLLSQLSRGVDGRDEKRPVLSDLRQSGDIEAAADLVLFPFRPAYYKAKGERELDDEGVEEAEVIIAKQRNGPTATVKIGFQPTCARWRQLART